MKVALIASLAALCSCSPVARDVSMANAEAAYNALQQWYNPSTGLWNPSTGWWESANCLTVITHLAMVDKNTAMKSKVKAVIENTYKKAQQYNLQMAKVHTRSQPYLPQTLYAREDSSLEDSGRLQPRATGGFLNGYYDDEGWWALAWIAAYDFTGNKTYLAQAQTIFNDMYSVFGKTNCSKNSKATGGIWWDKKHSYVNAIANELFLNCAAALANRVKGGSVDYLSIAKQQWAWFQGSGMINSGNTINDGLDQTTCANNQGTVWSYNQGVILGGLTQLSKATGDTSYITVAQNIADAAMAKLAPSGILKDPCEPDCGADGAQFKGVMARKIQQLYAASPQQRYATFLDNNANSIWSNDRKGYQLSIQWAGPYYGAANASTQSSAMDALVGSLAT